MNAHVEPIRKRRDIAKALATDMLLVPASAAQVMLEACADMIGVIPRHARHLPFAIESARTSPTYGAISEAKNQLVAALTEKPLSDAVMEVAFARLLAEGSHGNVQDRDEVVEGMVRAVGEACDPLGRALGLWPTTDAPIAPIVFALALRSLQANNTFVPKPAEVRAAIHTVYWRLRKLLQRLDERLERRGSINDAIVLHAPREQAREVLGVNDGTLDALRRFARERAGLPVDPDDEDEPKAEAS